jgi:hypothetical protein
VVLVWCLSGCALIDALGDADKPTNSDGGNDVPAGRPTFDIVKKTTLPMGIPFGFATGNFNEDANRDIVVAMTDTVRVFLGRGDGTFTDGEGVAMGAGDIGVGRFDGDGHDDLVLVGSTVDVAFGDGTGQFGSPMTTAGSGTSIAVGKLNGDTFSDVAVASGGNIVAYRGDGTAALVMLTSVSINGAPDPNTMPRGVAIAPIGGGAAEDDIAVMNQGTVSVLTNNGDGSSYTTTDIGALGVNGLDGFAAGKIDSDNTIDYAIARNQAMRVSVRFGDMSKSDHDVQIGEDIRAITIANLDGDALPDIAVATATNVTVMFGPTFAPQSFPHNGSSPCSPGLNTGGMCRAITSDDFNGDGRPDIAVFQPLTDAAEVTVLLAR